MIKTTGEMTREEFLKGVEEVETLAHGMNDPEAKCLKDFIHYAKYMHEELSKMDEAIIRLCHKYNA